MVNHDVWRKLASAIVFLSLFSGCAGMGRPKNLDGAGSVLATQPPDYDNESVKERCRRQCRSRDLEMSGLMGTPDGGSDEVSCLCRFPRYNQASLDAGSDAMSILLAEGALALHRRKQVRYRSNPEPFSGWPLDPGIPGTLKTLDSPFVVPQRF